MYGHPYQKSLCHAWSASPIYLFGAFRMGVQNTGIAYSTFDVRPLLGDMKSFEGTVPVSGRRRTRFRERAGDPGEIGYSGRPRFISAVRPVRCRPARKPLSIYQANWYNHLQPEQEPFFPAEGGEQCIGKRMVSL
jgi:hypothetical protein